ncbi:MAG TPA: response regulator transcription factor [Candidatus Sulfotelmatobacter sp.]|nr:response regulator transcription factor [Candidatus Sulfotelmatobacter sp.]
MFSRVLIADDNPLFRKALRNLLELGHYEVIEANDGQEAVTKTLKNRPDLVILDLAMPVMDGLAAAREISKLLPEIPVLMCTMHSSPQMDLEARKAGARKVIAKVHSALILQEVQQWLPGSASPPASEAPSLTAAQSPLPSPIADPSLPPDRPPSPGENEGNAA